MKNCVDCKWQFYRGESLESLCMNPKSIYSYTVGKAIAATYHSCSDMRSDDKECKLDALLFEGGEE